MLRLSFYQITLQKITNNNIPPHFITNNKTANTLPNICPPLFHYYRNCHYSTKNQADCCCSNGDESCANNLRVPLLLILLRKRFAYTICRPMQPQSPAGPTDAPIRPANGPDQRLLRVPHSSPPVTRRHLRRVPTGILCARPLGKPLHPGPNPGPFGPKSLSLLLLRRSVGLPGPPTIKQPQLSVPPPTLLHRDPRRFDLRR